MTDTIQPTIVRDTGDLLAALQARQRLLGWTDQFVMQVSGIDVAHVFENGRRPSCAVVDALPTRSRSERGGPQRSGAIVLYRFQS